jgi:excinuclease ABC subunit B
MASFKLKSKWPAAGDQPKAISGLVAGLKAGERHQTLLGVTGSGKTFTIANVINEVQKPTLVIAHNKTLAAQLAQEYRDFFPDAAVNYFVSYYDYYQPEAYLPVTDTYIEKDAQINQEIDRLRHASTQALLSRRDVIIVASVSAIYGLGSPAEYAAENLQLRLGQMISREDLIGQLVARHYERTKGELESGFFRAVGNAVEIWPPGERQIYELIFSGNTIAEINRLAETSRAIMDKPKELFLFPAKHFITTDDKLKAAIINIEAELKEQLALFAKEGKIVEAERLRRRTSYDLAMLREFGYTSGVENYSRHLSGRAAGSPPETLLSYFPSTRSGQADFLTVIDESHVTIPQLGGMYAGDRERKKTLIEYGFRLPSALDNRPLKFDEFLERVGPIIYTSATPGTYEREHSTKVVEQIIRPTGLVDPALIIKPIRDQVPDFVAETVAEIKEGGRVLVTTLTKKMAEDLAEFLKQKGIKAEYLHSDIKTLDRIKILTSFRQGVFDCLVGVNLLREGLDLPEVSLIGILDADREGFLRSEVSLIQTIGRAARNVKGRVILYADQLTGSLKRAIDETTRRRTIQLAYNQEHNITPQTIIKNIADITESLESERDRAMLEDLALDKARFGGDIKKVIKEKEKEMRLAVKALDFETAALLRDEIKRLLEN